MKCPEIRVGVDVGCKAHRVAVGDAEGTVLEEFNITHTQAGFEEFFRRVEEHRPSVLVPVAVAMEGFNGYARPLDGLVQCHGYALYNVNNLKLARFKEVFPSPAKTDPIDARKILQLFQLKGHLPLAKRALQQVGQPPAVHRKIKRLSRRRRHLVNEKIRVVNRVQADLQAVCPELLSATNEADNLWFLRFITCREDLRELAELSTDEIQQIRGIGAKFTAVIQSWQQEATFSSEVDYVGAMIITDAQRILQLIEQIRGLEAELEKLCQSSTMATHLRSIPGYGKTTVPELTGEIGTLERFSGESALAM